MKQLLTSAACAAALGVFGFGTASAAPVAVPQATVNFDYSYIDFGSGSHFNDWGGAASGVLPLGSSHFSVQVDGGYHNLSQSGFSGHVDDWNVDGAVAWRGSMGRVGATVGYNGLPISGLGTINITNYGAYGEWYATDRVTAGVKGGGVTLSVRGASTTGGYAGGELVGYATPDLALSATVDYTGFNGSNFTSGGVKAEYLVSRSVPVSVFGGYSYTGFSGFHSNTVSVGAKVYFGANGAPLIDRQREGVDNWGPSSLAQSLFFSF